MKKQMVSFTDPQLEFLKQEANCLGISVAELVRRIIDDYRLVNPKFTGVFDHD
jgi:hypothetical protein